LFTRRSSSSKTKKQKKQTKQTNKQTNNLLEFSAARHFDAAL